MTHHYYRAPAHHLKCMRSERTLHVVAPFHASPRVKRVCKQPISVLCVRVNGGRFELLRLTRFATTLLADGPVCTSNMFARRKASSRIIAQGVDSDASRRAHRTADHCENVAEGVTQFLWPHWTVRTTGHTLESTCGHWWGASPPQFSGGPNDPPAALGVPAC